MNDANLFLSWVFSVLVEYKQIITLEEDLSQELSFGKALGEMKAVKDERAKVFFPLVDQMKISDHRNPPSLRFRQLSRGSKG